MLAVVDTLLDLKGDFMNSFNISDAKARFSELIERVVNGEEIIIMKMSKPVAKLSTYNPTLKHHRVGYYKNRIDISDDFDAWSQEEARALGIVD